MSTPPTGNLVKWWPAVSDEPTPSETALHTRLLFNAANDHDQAITLLKQQLNNAGATATSVLEEIAAAVSSSGVTSFNTHIGNVTFFPQLGMVNDQLGNPTYLTQQTDSGVKIIVGDSTPVTVTLNAGVAIPWFTIIDNDSTSYIQLVPSSGALYGPNIIHDSSFGIVFYDGTDFWSGIAGGSGGGGIGPIGPVGPAGPSGKDGLMLVIDPEESAEPLMIPGLPGVAGAAGVQGPPGVAVFLEPDSPEEPMMIPGLPGTSGAGLTKIAQTVVAGSSTTSVTFSGIPGTFSNLRLTFVGQTSSASNDNLNIQFNSDSGAHYDNAIVFNSSSSAASGFSSAAQTALTFGAFVTPSSAAFPGQVVATIVNYAGTAFNKSVTSNAAQATSTTCNALGGANFWRSTAAITSMVLTLASGGHFIAGSTFTLYGES